MILVKFVFSDFLAYLALAVEWKMEVSSGSTVKEVFALLSPRVGDRFRRAVFDEEGNLQGSILVALDGRLIHSDQIAMIKIQKDSEIHLIPLALGG